MANPYTHTFKIKTTCIDVEGEMEFNVDDKVSFKTTLPLEGMKLDQMARIQSLFTELHRLFHTCGNIESVEIEEQ